MKKDRKFLILSLAIHALAILISAYIILPQNDKLADINQLLNVDFVKASSEEKRVVSEAKKSVPIEKPEELENLSRKPEDEPSKIAQMQPPNPDIIYTFAKNVTVPVQRQNMSETSPVMQRQFAVKAPEPTSIKVTKRIESIEERRSPELITTTQPIQNLGHKGTPTIALPSVGPLGAGYGSRDQGSKYIEAMSTVMPRGGVDQFAYIFPSIGEELAKRTKYGKLDVVFIIDATGSMEDNVVGVKNYISHFLRPFEEKNVDIRLGLVEFSDRDARKEKVHDPTDSPDKFKKWLSKMKFYGGRDLPESGYEAIIKALEKIDYRKSAHKAFVFISDSPQHDFDYDGKSRYTLDRIIAMLNEQDVSVDVIGLDFLPMKQLARGTGGQWKNIPGSNLRLDMPTMGPQKIHSNLSASMLTLEDNVVVDFESVVPDWVEISYKVLDPDGNKVLGALTYRKDVEDKSTMSVEIPVRFDVNSFIDRPGVYTLIYRTRDSYGNQNILRQNFELFIES